MSRRREDIFLHNIKNMLRYFSSLPINNMLYDVAITRSDLEYLHTDLSWIQSVVSNVLLFIYSNKHSSHISVMG